MFSSICLYGSNKISNVLKDIQISSAAIAKIRKTIIIDAGHGGEDGGAIGVNGILEKELNLKTAQQIYTLLKFSGYEVIMTRAYDKMLYDIHSDYQGKKKVLDLAARLNIIESTSPDLFLSIHMNSFPEHQYKGLTVYYSKNNALSITIASAIQKTVKDSFQTDNNREIKEAGNNIYLLDRATCPAILIECGFLSNPEECELLCDHRYRQAMTLPIFCATVMFLEKEP